MRFECLPCVRGVTRFGIPLNIHVFYTWLLKQVVKMVYCIRKEICLKNEEAIKDELAGVFCGFLSILEMRIKRILYNNKK